MMNILALVILSQFGMLSVRSAVGVPTASNLSPRSSLGNEVNSALKVLELASSSISEFRADEEAFPFATISYAQTIDGSIAPTARTRLDISSKQSFQLLHSLRACHDAVLVGVNTVFADDPQLNVREPLPGVLISYPRPVIIDSGLRIVDYPKKLRFTNPIVCTCVEVDSHRWKEAALKLSHVNGTLINCKASSSGRCNLEDCFRSLKLAGVKSLLVEGGANIIQSVLESHLASQVVVTIRPCFLGGYRSLTHELPQPLNLLKTAAASVGGDVVIYGRLQKGEIRSLEDSPLRSGSVSEEPGGGPDPDPEGGGGGGIRPSVEFLM